MVDATMKCAICDKEFEEVYGWESSLVRHILWHDSIMETRGLIEYVIVLQRRIEELENKINLIQGGFLGTHR